MNAAADRLILALDVETGDVACALLDQAGPELAWAKVGLELFCAEGADVVRRIKSRGLRVMLDLKLHDIPETVGRAVDRLLPLGVDLLTLHTDGGSAMMAAARASVDKAGAKTALLGVTVLTSMDALDLQEIGVDGPLPQIVAMRARLAVKSGLHGVVASPSEVPEIRRVVPPGFLVVTPGVRPAGADTQDQKRVTTPAQARSLGADRIVVGRPIRDAKNPADVVRAILKDLT